tara:strand:- start:578 stop:838 length:261 start_codon:yes stop_codon:yes gene_type:complete
MRLCTFVAISRQEIVDHLMRMRAIDVDYARSAFAWYDQKLPWLDLKNEIKRTIENEKKEQIQAAQSSARHSDLDQGGIQTSNPPKK